MSRFSSKLAVCATAVLAVTVSAVASAQEQRCGELGANCVCSEPFKMTGFTQEYGSDYWNPNDSTAKQCGQEQLNNPISRPRQGVAIVTDSTALSRLPTGNAVPRFVGSDPGDYDVYLAGGDKNVANIGAQYEKRMSIRFYIYHSPDYNFRYDSPGCHSKFLQGSAGDGYAPWHWENFEGYIHQYEFASANWGPAGTFPRDCCWNAPGAQIKLGKADWKGHWFRVEAVVINRAGGPAPNGVRNILYMKDVTKGVTQLNGGKEFIAADWAGTDTGPAPWLGWNNITSNPRLKTVMVNLYREVPSGGQCLGWRGISHMMIAGWDTDSGQRIGSAMEVEGVSGAIDGTGGGTPPAQTQPPAPTLFNP
jgi:hypothetical protein